MITFVSMECCAVWHGVAPVGPRGPTADYGSSSSALASMRSRVSKPSWSHSRAPSPSAKYHGASALNAAGARRKRLHQDGARAIPELPTRPGDHQRNLERRPRLGFGAPAAIGLTGESRE